MKPKTPTPPTSPTPKANATAPTSSAPHPGRNLGVHLKAPAGGEYVTSHHRGAKKR